MHLLNCVYVVHCYVDSATPVIFHYEEARPGMNNFTVPIFTEGIDSPSNSSGGY